jgi:hydrogenase/urease accessory protein HupE
MTGLLQRLCVAVLTLCSLGLLATSAGAHELSMADLQVREVARGEFVVHWGAGEKSAPADSMRPVWPAHCRAEAAALHCGAQGLTGVMSIQGVGDRFSAALVKITWLDGQSRVHTITAGQPSARLYGSADDQRGLGEVAWAYTTLGVEHILSGVDHLLFVGALLFLVGFRRQLVWTISAFTAAHSLTLASAALGWLTLRSPPVEASIALSIVLVAGEALHTRQTLAKRWPAVVAFLFGLVHGLGFAGALKDIGLPQQHLVAALLSFNLGVELGQLCAVGLVALVLWGLRTQRWVGALRTPALYSIGALAAYWSWQRVAAIVGVAA